MDQPNPMRQRVVVSLVCVAAALAGGGSLRAQDYSAPSGGGSFFSRDLGTAMRVDYNSQYYGTEEGVVAIGGMKVFSQEGSTWLLDAQGTLSDEFGGGFNAGIGYRQLVNTALPYDPQRIRGVSFWTDGQSTTNNNWFTQLGIGIESLGDRWDARLNTYLPLEREKAAGGTIAGTLDDPFYEGHFLVGGTQVTPIDTALTVVDAEFAHRLLDLEAWAFAGYYHLGGGGFDEDGYRIGFRGYAVPDIQVSVQVSDDDLYGTNVSAGLTWFVGRTHKRNLPVGTVLDRFREPVLRNDFIATTQRFETAGVGALTDNSTDEEFYFVHVDANAAGGGDGSYENPYNTLDLAETNSDADDIVLVWSGSIALTDNSTDEEFYFVHVDANAAGGGDGSYENPYNTLDLAETNSDADDIVLVWSGSAAAPTFTPAGTITIQEGQRWLGEGLDLDGEAVLHYVNTAELGLISLPETSVGSSEGFRPSITGLAGSDVFTLDADSTNAEINNFDVTGGATAINATDLNGFVGSNLALTNQTGDAVVLTDVSGTNIIDNSVVISGAGGRGIVISGGTGTLGAAATVESSTGLAVDIDGWTGGSVTLGQIGEVDDDGNPTTAHTGGVRVVNSTAGTINFSGVANIDTSGTDSLNAVYLENNEGATILFSELVATDDDDDTVLIRDGGTVQFYNTDDASTITSTGTGTAVRIQGVNVGNVADTYDDDPVVSVGSAIVNSGTGFAVSVDGIDSSVATTFSGDITDTTTNGSGIQVQYTTGGSVAFSGTVDLSTGSNNAVTLFENDGATITFADLTATAADTGVGGGTFVVQGGGTVTVNENADEDNYIQNTGTGDAVVIEGIDAGFTADPTVTINCAVENTGAGHVVLVNGVTEDSSGISFTNDVTDESGNGSGILVQNNADVSVAFSGTTTLDTGVNTAVMLSDNEGATITFNDLDATSSNTDATFLVVGEGTVTVNDVKDASLIANTGSGAAVYIDGDNGAGVTGDSTVTIAADVENQSTGRAVIVEDRTDNNVTFSGQVGTGSGATTDGGILVQNVTGGIVGFSEAVRVNTDDHTGIELLNNTDGTITFNGMDVTTDGQTGFSATGGGNLVVSDSVNSNTIDTTDGTGVVIDGMEIDSAGVAFDTIDVAGVGAGTVGVQFSDNTGGSISVTGDMDIETGAATAVAITGNDGASVTLSGDTIDLTGSTGVGIDISGTNTSVLVSADVENSEGTAVRIGGNPTAATISGNITADTARLLEVSGLTDGTVNVAGDMTHTGTGGMGILVNNNSGGALTVSGDIDVNTGANNAVTVSNSSNDFSGSFTGNIDAATTTGAGINVTGNTNTSSATFTGDIDITKTGAGSAVSFSANAGTFTGGITASSTKNLTVNASGGANGLAISGDGVISVTGNSGNNHSINVTGGGVGVDVSNTSNASLLFTTIDVTGANAVDISHTAATIMRSTFQDVTITSGEVGFNVSANSTAETNVVIDGATIAAGSVNQEGILIDTGASSNRVDFTLTDSVITADSASAVAATIDEGTGNVRFLIQGNEITSDSATAAFDVALTTGTTLSMQIGSTEVEVNDPYNPQDDPVSPIGDHADSNHFRNTGGGDAFAVVVNNVGATVNLDLRNNRAQGGNGFTLTQTMGTFNLVDATDTLNGVNNDGAVNDSGTINTISPPVAQPTP